MKENQDNRVSTYWTFGLQYMSLILHSYESQIQTSTETYIIWCTPTVLPMARRVIWVIRLTRGSCHCQLLHVKVLEKLYDGMLGGAGAGLAGPVAASSQRPRGT